MSTALVVAKVCSACLKDLMPKDRLCGFLFFAGITRRGGAMAGRKRRNGRGMVGNLANWALSLPEQWVYGMLAVDRPLCAYK